MESSLLYQLIRHIEYGTRLHIGVLFFENFGNEMCWLPSTQEIHHSPMCDRFKTYHKSAFRRCFRCRELAIQKALRDKVPFDGLCINGIYEYTHPVLVGDTVACMIFIGNILAGDEGLQKIQKRIGNKAFPIETLESTVTKEDCRRIALLIEQYILFLLERYPTTQSRENSVIKNVVAYVMGNLSFDIRMEEVAALFHYNPRYLGRLFKQEMGMGFREFINRRRVEVAQKRLRTTARSVIEIAGEVGFENVTYFNRVFKERYKHTPKQVRNKIE